MLPFRVYLTLTSPLITNLVPADESTVHNKLKPKISAYLDEIYQSNSGIDRPSVKIKVDGIDVTSYALIKKADLIDALVEYTPFNDLPAGKHNVTISAKDNAGRISVKSWNFYINITSIFNLTVYSPENLTYSDKKALFNITTAEDVANIEYINYADNNPRWNVLCRNCDGYGYDKKKTQTLREGWNNVTIRATDEFGFTKEKNIALFIDSEKPKISKVMPRRNSIINGSEFYIKYTEDNLQSVTLFWNPNKTLIGCSPGKNKECSTSVDLTAYDGKWIDYWFAVSDSINSANSSKTRVFVDVVSPELDVNMPRNEDQSYERKVPFDITASEEVTLEYYDSNEANPRWRNLCSRCIEYGNIKEKTKSFKKGIHNVLIRAVDGAGNSDTEEVDFNVD